MPLCKNALACSPERKKETAFQLTMSDCVAEQVFTVREGRIQEMGDMGGRDITGVDVGGGWRGGCGDSKMCRFEERGSVGVCRRF